MTKNHTFSDMLQWADVRFRAVALALAAALLLFVADPDKRWTLWLVIGFLLLVAGAAHVQLRRTNKNGPA